MDGDRQHQEAWDCKVVERYQFPRDVAGNACYDYDKQKVHHYQQA